MRRRRATRRTRGECSTTPSSKHIAEYSAGSRRHIADALSTPRRARVEHAPNARRHTSSRAAARAERRRAAAHRSIPLAIPRTLSHNRDEFKNSEQRRRACDAQALSNSEDGGEGRAEMPATSQTPRRQLARFEARFFGAALQAHFRTRLSAHIAPRCRRRASANGHAYVKWRA